jgi:hypothetical protein
LLTEAEVQEYTDYIELGTTPSWLNLIEIISAILKPIPALRML